MSRWSDPLRALAVLAALSAPAGATDGPISAIDWLSNVLRGPAALPPETPTAPDVSNGAGAEDISVAPLDDLSIDAVGLLPTRVTGLPGDFWGTSSTSDLIALMDAQRTDLPRPAQRLLRQLLLAELQPPVDAGPDHALFLARIDTLLKYGALHEAQALVERAGPTDDPEVFRRWFDISLLLGDANRACAAMRAAPDIAPTFMARIFCLARGGDWPAAALSLETARALGFVTEAEDQLMARFLDPELFEGTPMAAPPRPMTPLVYQMLAALGEAPPASGLPLAFSHALLGPNNGWKTRLEASERLARTGGITPSQLFSAYTERRPAASGGLWDRVASVQALDVALLAGDDAAVSDQVNTADAEMRGAGLEPIFASYYGVRVARLPLSGEPRQIAERLVLQTPAASSHARRISDPFLAAIAGGTPPAVVPEDPMSQSVAAAFRPTAALPPAEAGLLREGRRGELALRALATLSPAIGDPADLETALIALRQLGFEQTARQSAIALLLNQRAA